MTAIEKINEEMQKNPDDQYTEYIGSYVIDRCSDPDVAEKVMAEDKSLKGCMDEILGAAKKVAKQTTGGSVAAMTPNAVFAIVDTYFGIPADRDAWMKILCGLAPEPVNEETVSLDLASFF